MTIIHLFTGGYYTGSSSAIWQRTSRIGYMVDQHTVSEAVRCHWARNHNPLGYVLSFIEIHCQECYTKIHAIHFSSTAENEFLRDILQLGPKMTLANGVPLNKQSKLERHLVNAAAFKARTLSLRKNRDKRSAVY